MTARRLLRRYGHEGILHIPDGPGIFDPDTGENTVQFTESEILMVPVPFDDYSGGDLDPLIDSVVWFMPHEDINKIANIVKTINGCYITTDYPDTTKYDLRSVNFVIERGKVVAIEATTRAL